MIYLELTRRGDSTVNPLAIPLYARRTGLSTYSTFLAAKSSADERAEHPKSICLRARTVYTVCASTPCSFWPATDFVIKSNVRAPAISQNKAARPAGSLTSSAACARSLPWPTISPRRSDERVVLIGQVK